MLGWVARKIFRVTGWTIVGEVPNISKAVFIAAPHTSNWDGLWLLIYKFAINVDVRFLAKDTLFWWPLGPLLRAMGAMPIDRRKAATIVPQLVDAFAKEEHLFLALAPEGTRKRMPYWKSGFYRIAEAANVPVVLAFINYEQRQMGIGPALPLGISIEETLEALREFYAPHVGRRPELQSPIEFPPE
ncbi:MAG: lysophospholipid acyltransferase family protein [Woeseiaceae bacterium]